MALSKTRRNEIAWKLLLHTLSTYQVKEFTRRRLHDKLKSNLAHLPPSLAEICENRLWDFCADLVNAVQDESQKDDGIGGTSVDENTEFELPKEHRLSIGYAFLLCLKYDEGLRVGKSMKRELLTKAGMLNIPDTEAISFARTMVSTLLGMALKQKN